MDEKKPDVKIELDNEYASNYSEESFWEKIVSIAQKAGIAVIYAGLLLFYTLQKPNLPVWARGSILGALGYFISPLDVIPDITPVVGYSDDLTVLILALGAVAIYIDEDVRRKAKAKLDDWFHDYDSSLLQEIDSKLRKEEV